MVVEEAEEAGSATGKGKEGQKKATKEHVEALEKLSQGTVVVATEERKSEKDTKTWIQVSLQRTPLGKADANKKERYLLPYVHTTISVENEDSGDEDATSSAPNVPPAPSRNECNAQIGWVTRAKDGVQRISSFKHIIAISDVKQLVWPPEKSSLEESSFHSQLYNQTTEWWKQEKVRDAKPAHSARCLCCVPTAIAWSQRLD